MRTTFTQEGPSVTLRYNIDRRFPDQVSTDVYTVTAGGYVYDQSGQQICEGLRTTGATLILVTRDTLLATIKREYRRMRTPNRVGRAMLRAGLLLAALLALPSLASAQLLPGETATVSGATVQVFAAGALTYTLRLQQPCGGLLINEQCTAPYDSPTQRLYLVWTALMHGDPVPNTPPDRDKYLPFPVPTWVAGVLTLTCPADAETYRLAEAVSNADVTPFLVLVNGDLAQEVQVTATPEGRAPVVVRRYILAADERRSVNARELVPAGAFGLRVTFPGGGGVADLTHRHDWTMWQDAHTPNVFRVAGCR